MWRRLAGLFMALQPRIIACGNKVATFAMAVRFLMGPAVMAVASFAVGLQGTLLRVAIVQVLSLAGVAKRKEGWIHGENYSYLCSFSHAEKNCLELDYKSMPNHSQSYSPLPAIMLATSFYYSVSASAKALSPFSHRALLFSCFVDEQAALPQGIVPFVFAKEYNLHPDILSTA
jgi:hypothetical protein